MTLISKDHRKKIMSDCFEKCIYNRQLINVNMINVNIVCIRKLHRVTKIVQNSR